MHIGKSTWLKFNVEVLIKIIIYIFMLVLLTDNTSTFVQVTRDVRLHTLIFVVDLGSEHQQKLGTQTEPVNAACVVCARGRSPWCWVMPQVLV